MLSQTARSVPEGRIHNGERVLAAGSLSRELTGDIFYVSRTRKPPRHVLPELLIHRAMSDRKGDAI